MLSLWTIAVCRCPATVAYSLKVDASVHALALGQRFHWYSAFRNFFPKLRLILKKSISGLSDWAQIFRKDSLCHPLAPNFSFGGVIFKIMAEFRFFSRFHGNVSKTTRFSQTLFDYNTLVSCSIFLKFSGKTPDAIFLPQFSFRVVIFSLRPEFRFLCTFSRST